MRLASLFLRSRLTGWALVWLAAGAAAGWAWLTRMPDALLRISLIVVPLLPATVIGASAYSPFGEAEETASRSLPGLRLGHVAGLLVLGALAIGVAGVGMPSHEVSWEMIRTLVGYAGLALLCGRLLGSRVSWLAPLAYATLALYLDPASRWAWPKQHPLDSASILVAVALVVVGLLAAMRSSARDYADDR